jgi:hypothetical protein
MVSGDRPERRVGSGARRRVIDGVTWTVESFEPQFGRVLLRGGPGQVQRTTVRALLNDSGCRASTASTPAWSNRDRQPATLHDLSDRQQELVRLRYAHVQEAETGFRSGDPCRALPGEPRTAYDPAVTTVGQRRAAKAAELRAMGWKRPGCWASPHDQCQ